MILKMKNKKRGLQDKGLLDSVKNKIVFSLIVLMFGVVIFLAVIDIINEINIRDQAMLGSPNEEILSKELSSNTNIIQKQSRIYGEPAQERFLALARSELRYS